jgi:hypothetical protein
MAVIILKQVQDNWKINAAATARPLQWAICDTDVPSDILTCSSSTTLHIISLKTFKRSL